MVAAIIFVVVIEIKDFKITQSIRNVEKNLSSIFFFQKGKRNLGNRRNRYWRTKPMVVRYYTH